MLRRARRRRGATRRAAPGLRDGLFDVSTSQEVRRGTGRSQSSPPRPRSRSHRYLRRDLPVRGPVSHRVPRGVESGRRENRVCLASIGCRLRWGSVVRMLSSLAFRPGGGVGLAPGVRSGRRGSARRGHGRPGYDVMVEGNGWGRVRPLLVRCGTEAEVAPSAGVRKSGVVDRSRCVVGQRERSMWQSASHGATLRPGRGFGISCVCGKWVGRKGEDEPILHGPGIWGTSADHRCNRWPTLGRSSQPC